MCCKTAEVRKYNCRFLFLRRKPRTQGTLTTHQSFRWPSASGLYLVSVSPAVCLLDTQHPILTTTTAIRAVLAGLYHPAISHTSVLPLGVSIIKNPSIALDCKLSYDSRAEASANPGWYRVSKGYPITDRLDAPSERRCRKTPTGCKARAVGLAGFNVALCRTTGTSRFVCQIMVLNMLAATVRFELTSF